MGYSKGDRVKVRHDVKVGTVFVESWGYDQTNVNAYEVVRVSAASVYIQPCDLEIVGGRVRPVPGTAQPFPFILGGVTGRGKVNARGEIRKVIRRGWNGAPRLTMTSYSGAYLWDGSETYHDTYAAGEAGH